MDYFEALNDRQKEAVLHTEGPLLILAGAGSGKTRVLTSRVSYLIKEKGIKPWNILAITFTNKAAGEMRERVNQTAGMGSEAVWVATFHSTCLRMIRRTPDLIGFDDHFVVYDTDDSRRIMKQVIAGMKNIPSNFSPKSVLGAVSRAKNDFLDPDELLDLKGYDYYWESVAEAYREYQKRLLANDAMDFDDLLINCVRLLSENPDILENWQERFRYIMVDEYQDTNAVQFEFVRLLGEKYRNVCVVGDDDQSIYRFRGADIKNILSFESTYNDAYVVRLEQNYRSTQSILDAANAVISNNEERREKKLWTDKGQGEIVRFRSFYSPYNEAEYVINDIISRRKSIGTFNDFAVLYRTNAQSRSFEEHLIAEGIPYSIVGGVNFYSRREIKDVLAYLRLLDSPRDDVSAARILNVPKRGIGKTTESRISSYALSHDISFYEAMLQVNEIPGIATASAKKIKAFTDMVERWRETLAHCVLPEIAQTILEDIDYKNKLEADSDEDREERLQNVGELLSKMEYFAEENENADLTSFLAEVALMTDLDQIEEGTPRVLLMTLHSAKGLEFPCVYITGLDEGVFPGRKSIDSFDDSDMEEERRLMYVGITRAMDQLTLTHSSTRMVNGSYDTLDVSRFVREIPEELLDEQDVDGGGTFSGSGRSAGRSFTGNFRNSGTSGFSRQTGSAPVFSTRQIGMVSSESNNAYKHKAYSSLNSTSNSASSAIDYSVGDRVMHQKFGEGTVLEMAPGPRDTVVTVEFDHAGQKVMYAGFAKLKKI